MGGHSKSNKQGLGSNIVSLRLVLTLTLVIALFSCHTIQSEAAQYNYKGKALGIVISKSCLMSQKCLHYSDIRDFDNSDSTMTGPLVLKDGDYVRQASSKQNNYYWLQYSKNYTVMLDPALKFRDQIPLITIVPTLDEFHLQGQFAIKEYKLQADAKATQDVRSYSHTRYVDSTCTNAIITAKDWKKVLPDTIDYLRNNCDSKHTKLTTITNEMRPLTKHDLGTSNKWKLDQFYKNVIEKCTKSRNACTEIENKSITTMGDSK